MQGSSGPGVRLCCLQIDDHSRLVDLLVEPQLLEAPAVVDAVYHDGQSLHPRLPARAATRVKDHRPGTILGQASSVAQPRHRLQEADDLLTAEHHRQLLRLLGADDAIERLWPAQRHTEEEAQGARHLIDVRPRPAKPGQVKLVGANLLDPQPIRRTAKKTAELGNRVDVGLLSCWRKVANRHVVDHPSTQRGHLSHHRIHLKPPTLVLADSSLEFGCWPFPRRQTSLVAHCPCSVRAATITPVGPSVAYLARFPGGIGLPRLFWRVGSYVGSFEVLSVSR